MGDSDFDTRRKALERQRRSLQIEWEEVGGRNPHLAAGDSVANVKRAEVLHAQIVGLDAQLQRLQEEEVDAARKAAGVPGTLEDRLKSLEKLISSVAALASHSHKEVRRLEMDKLPGAILDDLASTIASTMKKYVGDQIAQLRAERSGGGMVWLGPFENGKSYAPGQCVRHSGDAWCCVVETGTAPTADNAMWSLVVRGAR